MGKFFEELAKKLAERWVALLVLPGILLVILVTAGSRLGHRHALDWDRAKQHGASIVTAISREDTSTQILILVAVLLAAAGSGLLVQALTGITRNLWLGLWPAICARRLSARRRRRWHVALNERRELERRHPAGSRTAEQQAEIDAAAAKLVRISPAEPGAPTWMGDRVHAVEQAALNRHGFDLTFGWSRLWLTLPDVVRTDLTAAEGAFAAAVMIGSWVWPYLMLGLFWWPAVAIAVGVGVTGWARARAAIADLTTLSEAAIDLHGQTLAVALGVRGEGMAGPLTFTEGEAMTAIVRKGR